MKYLYHRTDGVFLMIKDTNESTNYPHVEITDSEAENILLAKDAGKIIKVIDGKYLILVNEITKRQKIVKERNELLIVVERFIDRPTYTNKLGLTIEDLEDAKEYYIRLLDMPQHFDTSDDKQNWQYVFIDVYTSGKNTNNYQLFKPSFVK